MIADIDKEGKRKVDFNDFLAMMTMKLGDRDTRKDINQVRGLASCRECAWFAVDTGEEM